MAILIAIALIAVAWVLSLVIRFALSRSRELLADAGSVELTKNPDAMISALRKIEGRGELAGATSAVMEMCVDNPREEFSDLFATHPPIEQRIAAIIKFAGGHDPGPLALPEPGAPAPRRQRRTQPDDQQQAARRPVPGATPASRQRRPARRCRRSCEPPGAARPATAAPLPTTRAPGGRTPATEPHRALLGGAPAGRRHAPARKRRARIALLGCRIRPSYDRQVDRN